MVAHELPTPLASVMGFAKLLGGQAAYLESQHRAWASHLQQSADAPNLLVMDLIDVSRIQGGTMPLEVAEFDLAASVWQTAKSFRINASEKDQSLSVDVPKEPIPMSGGERRIRQVVANLLSNASKYSLEGTQVGCAVAASGGCIEIRITDRGIGMADDEQAQLFEPFFRSDSDTVRAVRGTGPGLSICKGIVAHHGGEIAVESTPGEGSTFAIRLSAQGVGPGRCAAA